MVKVTGALQQNQSCDWTCSCFSTRITLIFLDSDNWIFTMSCAFVVKVLHEPDSVPPLVFVWIKHACFLFYQGKGVEAGPDQVVWRLTCCMGLHRMLPVFIRLSKLKRPNDIPACIEAYLLYCHPRQTIKVLESNPGHPVSPFRARLNKPTHYYPPVI